jgi:hypothetical protein
MPRLPKNNEEVKDEPADAEFASSGGAKFRICYDMQNADSR